MLASIFTMDLQKSTIHFEWLEGRTSLYLLASFASKNVVPNFTNQTALLCSAPTSLPFHLPHLRRLHPASESTASISSTFQRELPQPNPLRGVMFIQLSSTISLRDWDQDLFDVHQRLMLYYAVLHCTAVSALESVLLKGVCIHLRSITSQRSHTQAPSVRQKTSVRQRTPLHQKDLWAESDAPLHCAELLPPTAPVATNDARDNRMQTGVVDACWRILLWTWHSYRIV